MTSAKAYVDANRAMMTLAGNPAGHGVHEAHGVNSPNL